MLNSHAKSLYLITLLTLITVLNLFSLEKQEKTHRYKVYCLNYNPTNEIQKNMILTLLKQIFSRPYLAALIVGSLIHVGKWLNYSAHNLSYFDTFHHLVINGIPFMLIDSLLPFAIPFIVVSISRHLSTVKEREFFSTFPELNPDIVIKCNYCGEAQYLNHATKKFLERKKMPADDINALIPKNLCSLDFSSLDFPYRIEHQVAGETIEYLVSRAENNDLFLAGRIKRV